MMIITKTREKITPADEVDLTTAESLAQVEGLIREARRESTLDDSAARIQVSIYKLSPKQHTSNCNITVNDVNGGGAMD